MHRDIFVDVFGVYNAAVAQRHAFLALVEARFGKRGDVAADDRVLGGVAVYQTLDGTAFEQMLFDDLGHVFDFDSGIEDPFGVNDHYGAERAKAETAGVDDLYLVLKPFGFELCFKRFRNGGAVRRSTAGAAADKNMSTYH